MAGRAAVRVSLSDRHRSLLERLLRRQTSSQRRARRIRVVRDAGLGRTHEALARRQGIRPQSVQRGRGRWSRIGTPLNELEASFRLKELKESQVESLLLHAGEEALADAPRPGTPATFTPEQIVAIVAVALEDPVACGRPVTPWTPREIAEEAIQRGRVLQISARSGGRFLKGGRPQAPSEPLLASTRDRRSSCV